MAAAALLMVCYLRTAGTVPVLSDGAGNALQAWDMLHGNLLLHGWWATDVSFYTTELPQYMLVEAVAGLRPEVVHIGAAMTYTLLVLLAAFVARGRARGAEGVVRAVLAAGIMLAPQPGPGTWILMSSPDHVGSAVPVLVLLLILDFARPRRWVPVAAGALLAASIVGDPLIMVIGAAALALACLLRAARIALGAGAGLRAAWYELSLAAAALIAVPAASVAGRVLVHLGGFRTDPDVASVVPIAQVRANVPLWVRSLLSLFGADWPEAQGRLDTALAFVHLAGAALVLAAVIVAAWRLLRPARGDLAAGDLVAGDPADGDLVADILVIAVVANAAAYLLMFRLRNIYIAHEAGPVLALGAALAGRIVGGALPRARLVPALAAGLACYCAMLGFAAARPQAAPQSAALVSWLERHDLRSGIAGYWQGSSVILDSRVGVRMVTVTPVSGGRILGPRHWLADLRLADPATHSANFVVVGPDRLISEQEALATFGRPARVYHDGSYTILTWKKNLLRELGPASS